MSKSCNKQLISVQMNHHSSKVVLKKLIKHTRQPELLFQNFTTCTLMICSITWRVSKCLSHNTLKSKTLIIHLLLKSLEFNSSKKALVRWMNSQIWLNHCKPQKLCKTTCPQIFCIQSGRTIKAPLKLRYLI